MKKAIFKHMIPILGLIFLSSCSELLYTSVDVLRPAKVSFDLNASNLLIVNNSVVQPNNIGHRLESLGKKTKIVTVETDSIAMFCLAALTEELDNKNFFKTIQTIPASLNKTGDFNIINPLDKDSVEKMCTLYNADAILCLDKIKVNDDISEYYIPERNALQAVLEVRYQSFWSIHYPGKPDVTNTSFKDTIYWESETTYGHTNLELPKRIDGIIDGALYVGKKSVSRFIPYWEKVDRYFFNSPNKYIRQGMDSLYVKNWESAIKIWEQAVKKSGSRTRGYAANNMAVAYEIIGNLDKALEYATMAYYNLAQSGFSNMETLDRIYQYVAELSQRKTDIDLLKKQIGE